MAPQHIYDVFLSFSGFDTRHNFTSHLLAALEQHGIHTFRDDKKLNKGEYIRYELLKAIEESRISLIVLSKSYATSNWCLDELVKIMECRKALQQIVLPIFYYVEPSDVRVQKGSLAEAFSKHEECFKEDSDGRVEKWREALTDVANLSGWDVPKVANGDEAHLIRKVVEEVQNKLYLAHGHVAHNQIGLEFHLQKLKKFKTEPDDVRNVAIWGIGGIGSSMASSSSANTENEYPTYPTCKCGKAAPLRRSKTIATQGRRFLGCANYEIRQERCNYFYWIDPPTREKELEAKKVGLEAAPLRRSKTIANQERRVLGCANYEIRQKRCNYFYWVDPPTREKELEATKFGLERNSEDMGKMIQQLSKEKKKKLKKKMMAQEAKKVGLEAAPLRRSKTIANQERRFSGCANYEIRQKRCNYFYWVDPPTREKELEATKVGLERNSEDMGKMIQQLSKEKKKKLKKKMMAQEAKVNLKRKLMPQEAKANSYKLKCLMLIVACIILYVVNNYTVKSVTTAAISSYIN